MKKLLFIACSFAMAVGIFAFTVDHKGTTPKFDQEYYWYTITYDGHSPMIEEQEPISHISLGDAVNLGYGCGGSDRLCKAGFVEELAFPNGNPKTTDTGGDVATNFKEVDPN